MDYIAHAHKLRPLIVKAAQSLDDKDASEAVELYDGMHDDGSLIKAGTRINWRGTLKQAAVDLWDTQENNPDQVPLLWLDIAYREGIRIIPEVIAETGKFARGERGWWKGEMYESVLDNNVHTPQQYAPGWKMIDMQKIPE